MDNSPLGPRGRGLQLIRYHTPLPPTRFVAHLAYAFRAFPCPPPRTFFSRTPRGWITQRRRRLYRPLAEQNTPRQASARSATPHHGSPHSQGGEETREGNVVTVSHRPHPAASPRLLGISSRSQPRRIAIHDPNGAPPYEDVRNAKPHPAYLVSAHELVALGSGAIFSQRNRRSFPSCGW